MDSELDAKQQWRNILDRDTLKGSINVISLYIMVYELLEDSVVCKPKDFYTIWEFDEKAQKEYKEKVLSLYDKNACPGVSDKRKDIIASLVWFKNNGAIDDNDIKIFAESKQLRNNLTHEMLSSIANGTEHLAEQFALMYALFCKIEKWWIMEVEIPTGEDFEPEEVNEEGVMSGNMVVLEIILDILANNSNTHFMEACDALGVPIK